MKNTNLVIFAVLAVVAVIGLVSYGSVKPATTEPTAMMEKKDVMEPVPTGDTAMENAKTIVDIASENGSFTTLVAAVQAAGLVETLSGEGPFTVFAPTDEAFAKLPEGTVEGLLEDKEQLSKILTYHVVAGKVMAADVVNLDSAKTVEGSSLPIKVQNGTVMVGDAKVVTPDIEASNGVIHVIDTVLLPK